MPSRCSSRTWPPHKAFYLEVFELPVAFEDPNSTVFMFGETAINLLDVPPGAEPSDPAPRRVTGCRVAHGLHPRGG